MTVYHQDVVINQLNRYLKLNKRSIKLKKGYCHGFSLLWLYSMSTGNEKWFYDAIRQISTSQSKAEFDRITPTIEKFLAHIEWLHNSSNYVDTIHQLDIDKILEMPRTMSLAFLFTHRQLKNVLKSVIHQNEMICISGPDHTIGLYFRNERFYLFDPNYDRGKAKRFSDISLLEDEILRCLFRDKLADKQLIPIEINIVHAPVNDDALTEMSQCDDEKKSKLLDKLIHGTKVIDAEGFNGITNLYLACESGDELEVTRLLQEGADPNLITEHDWTPLETAANKGYIGIIKLLLENGANPNLADSKQYAPLYLAARNEREDIVKLLMQHGANPNLPSYKNKTPLTLAIKAEHWDMIAMMLAYSKGKSRHILKNDLILLKQHKDEVTAAAKRIQPQLLDENKLQLARAMNALCPIKLSMRFFSHKHTAPANDRAFLYEKYKKII